MVERQGSPMEPLRPQSSNEGSVFMTQLLPRCHHIDWVSMDTSYGNTDFQDSGGTVIGDSYGTEVLFFKPCKAKAYWDLMTMQ